MQYYFAVLAMCLFPKVVFAEESVNSHHSWLVTAAQYVSFYFTEGVIILSVSFGITFILYGLKEEVKSFKKILVGMLWAVSILLLIGAHFLSKDFVLYNWFVPTGSVLLLVAMLYVDGFLKESRNASFFLTVVYYTVTMVYTDTFVAVLTVIAFVTYLSQVFKLVPLGWFSYRNREPEAAFASLVLLLIYSVCSINGYGHGIEIFMDGTYWVGMISFGLLAFYNGMRSGNDVDRSYYQANVLYFSIVVVGILVGTYYGLQNLVTHLAYLLYILLMLKVYEVGSDEKLQRGIKLVVIAVLTYLVFIQFRTEVGIELMELYTKMQ